MVRDTQQVLSTDAFINMYVLMWASAPGAASQLADLHKGPKAHCGKGQLWLWAWGTGIGTLQKERSSL